MQKKKKARDRSTQELMGVTAIRDYGISTPHGDIVFFVVKPTNLSVLPDSGVEGRVPELVVYSELRFVLKFSVFSGAFAAFTVTVQVSGNAPAAAVTFALPAPTAVTSPPSDTVTTFVSSLTQYPKSRRESSRRQL